VYADPLLFNSGCVESGFIPGSLYIISTFYKREELAARNAAFFLGSGLASAVTGLFAFAILRHAGAGGYAGWQLLFIIEGCLAIGVAIFFFLVLPQSPQAPTPFLFPRLHYFNERQRYILAARVIHDDARKAEASKHISVKEIAATVTNPRVLPHVLLAITLIAPTAALGSYVPTLIKSFGFDTLKVRPPLPLSPTFPPFLPFLLLLTLFHPYTPRALLTILSINRPTPSPPSLAGFPSSLPFLSVFSPTRPDGGVLPSSLVRLPFSCFLLLPPLSFAAPCSSSPLAPFPLSC
jgi:hypothetical protein